MPVKTSAGTLSCSLWSSADGMNRELKVKGGAAAVVLVLFAAGTALGLALGQSQSEAGGLSAPIEGRLSLGASEQSKEWIVDGLDLTPDQRAAVDSVVEHFGHRMSSLQKEYRPRYRAIVDSASQALRSLLTDEQRARYDSLQAAAKRGVEETAEPETR
jgi:hypothetical protein